MVSFARDVPGGMGGIFREGMGFFTVWASTLVGEPARRRRPPDNRRWWRKYFLPALDNFGKTAYIIRAFWQ